jgi:hypothetical protein
MSSVTQLTRFDEFVRQKQVGLLQRGVVEVSVRRAWASCSTCAHIIWESIVCGVSRPEREDTICRDPSLTSPTTRVS